MWDKCGKIFNKNGLSVVLMIALNDAVGITSLRSVFPSSAGHHRPKQKRPSAALRPSFFALHRPLRKRAFDGAAQHEKSAQLALSAFALVVIRLGFGRITRNPEESSVLRVL